MTEEEIEQNIRAVNATMAMEGMPLTSDDKRRLRAIFEGKTTTKKTIQELLEKYSKKAKEVI
jgi:hypothetical protein